MQRSHDAAPNTNQPQQKGTQKAPNQNQERTKWTSKGGEGHAILSEMKRTKEANTGIKRTRIVWKKLDWEKNGTGHKIG
jgi:hypothetical protein